MNQEVFNEIKIIVRDKISISDKIEDGNIKEIIDEVILQKGRDIYISNKEKVELARNLFNSIRKLDILQPLLEDDKVTEIMVNGKDDVFIEKEGRVVRANISFSSQEKLEDLIQNIVSKVNRSVNITTPICDARLSDGSRINIVLPPIALNGPLLTIRKFSKNVISMEELVGINAISEEAAIFLKKAVEAKYNIFVCGGTGTGKTTFLNILSNYIPRYERIITIEDSAELKIRDIDNVVRMETRNASVDGTGVIGIRQLIKSSLRMRPDRIIVGEVRGEEAIDMLQAMNTGHDGSLSTGHANTPKDMINRLETMILTSENIPIQAVKKQIASSIDIIIHLGKQKDGSRKVLEIVEVEDYKGENITLNSLFKYKILGKLESTGNELKNREKFKLAGMG